MNSLPMPLLDKILFRLDLKSLVMMQCTNRYIKSHISDDPSFEIGYSSHARLSYIYTFSKGAPFVFYQPFGSACDSRSYVKTFASLGQVHCYILGSCCGHLLLYMSGLYVVNPLTKRVRLLDHSGSMLLATIFNGPNNKANNAAEDRSMCVGFALDHSRADATKGFKIICILEIHTTYAFEVSDGTSWRFSETIITTTNSKSELTKRMKPVYLEGTLHWLRNDGSIIAFNIETEKARFIPSVFHRPEPEMKLFFALDVKINRLTLISGTKETISVYTLTGDTKWALARQIENILMTDSEFEYWNVVAYDGKYMVVKDKEKGRSTTGGAHVYNMEDNRWGAWWSTACQAKYNLDLFRFTPFFSFFEHTEVLVEDSTNGDLAQIMRLIDTTKQKNKFFICWA
ncbi:hypothetical protein Bca52824_011878 [Brassica carinata]|uniref:F-box domain-containing protein n=1 Tax=Brassica carinata TaxID=52824 RepID=A0A8X7VX44_BRACI|nr:hypothetical protein Bca52824_011878 [Brassica carinata]